MREKAKLKRENILQALITILGDATGLELAIESSDTEGRELFQMGIGRAMPA